MPSPKLPTFLAASARCLLTACVPLLVGIGTPRTRFREFRPASAAPPARPASPMAAASAGPFAFLATSPTAPPAFLTCSVVASAALATGVLLELARVLLELARFERGLELCRLDERAPGERDDEARLVAVEPDPFARVFVARGGELGLELCRLDERAPGERDDEARLVTVEPDPFARVFVARELARAAPGPPLRLARVEADRREELEFDRLALAEFLVCWGI
jgi:hypothetical protein